MYGTPKFVPVADALKCGLEKLQKWYKTIDESDTYFICLGNFSSITLGSFLIYFSVLHPAIKLAYCKDKWDKLYYDARYSALEQVVCVLLINDHISTDFNKFDTYYKPLKKLKASTSALEVKSQG